MTESSTITASPAISSIPPIPCKPWCEDGAGHVGAADPEDQYCSAGYLEMELARETEELGGRYYPRSVVVTLEANPFSDAFVRLSTEPVTLTPDEARRLGEHLISLHERALHR